MKKFAISTLGCKVNQYESALITESLAKSGYRQVDFTGQADIYIVNTCTVTAKASYQSRQLLRRSLRLNPHSIIAAVGCYPEVEADKIASMGIATHILGNLEKLNIVRYLELPGSLREPLVKVSMTKSTSSLELFPLEKFPGRTRAFLKIQDGCNTFCTYCIVPHTRGKSRSLKRRDVLIQIEHFIARGFKEIVLTGIHLGKWGEDLTPTESLSSLLEEILISFPGCRFRISSIEPPELTEAILTLMAEHDNFCKHLHVPLQSGSDEILRRMHRPYTAGYYLELFRRAHDMVPELAWGLDVIVGFPGESEDLFSETYELLKDLPLAYMHVFPFSPRNHTPAVHFPGQVPAKQKKRRAAILRELSNVKRKEFLSRFLGKILHVLVEGKFSEDKNYFQGLSSNYIRVYFKRGKAEENSIVRVIAEKLFENGLLGKVVG